MINVTSIRLSRALPLLLSTVTAVVIGFVFAAPGYTLQGIVLALAVIGILAVVLVPRLARRQGYEIPMMVLAAALVFKLGFAMLRHWTSFVVYGGLADAAAYDRYGTIISQHIWRAEFTDLAPYLAWGTRSIELFTGAIYTVTGPSIYAGYLFYALLSFLGSYFFYRAFRAGFPGGNTWLYTVLIFFFPTLLFWPNGIGKDALIFLWLGIFAYGCALMIRHEIRGLFPLLIGLAGTLWIRPHIAAIATLAFTLAFFLPGTGRRPFRAATFVIVLVAAVGFAWLVLPTVASYIGLEELSPQGLVERFQLQQTRNLQGGSAFGALDLTNPLAYPMSLVNLLFRPFPWEAHHLLALIQSLESFLVIGLVVWRIKSLGQSVASAFSDGYVRFLILYIIGFAIAFSVVANFGILARQRTMFLPFFFMLLCYLPFRARRDAVPGVGA